MLPLLGMMVLLVLMATASAWLLQSSINSYMQQTYHRPSPLEALEAVPGWTAGGRLWAVMVRRHDLDMEYVADVASTITISFNQRFVLTDAYHRHQRDLAEQTEALRRAKAQEMALLEERERRERYLSLTANDKVFMAGDSLMQGVAPHMQRELESRYGIKSVNLSRQSTGLSYPGSFDWPGTIEQTRGADSTIRLVIVLLGPNDPWDMPDPAHPGGPFLRFRAGDWEQAYRARVARIIQGNAAHGVSTLWVGAPGMRADRLDSQMEWLMGVIKDEVEAQGAVFMDTRQILAGAGSVGGYQDSVEIDAKQVKMRSGDGIHFSLAGQKHLAQQIMGAIRLPSEPGM